MAAVILFAAETIVPGVAADSRETIRLTVLDLCVMSESQKRQVRDRIADECRCASASVAKNMSDAEVKAFKDELTPRDQKVWDAAVAACFKS
jgi:hypothetical protein